MINDQHFGKMYFCKTLISLPRATERKEKFKKRRKFKIYVRKEEGGIKKQKLQWTRNILDTRMITK